MTSTNVLQAPAGNGQLLHTKEKAGKGSVMDIFGQQTSFSTFIGNAANRTENVSAASANPNPVSETRQISPERKITSVETKNPADKIAEASDTVQETKEKLLSTVADGLDLDESELADAMTALGMSAFDLLDPQKLAQLYMQVSGENSEADLLLDSQFVDLMQSVSGVEQELMGTLKVTPEEMDEVLSKLTLLENAKEEISFEQAVKESGEMAQMPKMSVQQGTGEDKNPSAGEKIREQTEETVALEESVEPSQKKTGEMSGQWEGQDRGDAKPGQENPAEFLLNKSGGRSRNIPAGEAAESPVQLQSFGGMLEASNVTGAPAMEEGVSSLRPMELIQQIAEHVKVSISQESSSMEMQLNPENLGKIYLQVSAKEGSVHATIAAQNEAVKAALESQVADLKESLNQAGVKVDAVEVTVASHEFEKNLEQNERRQQEEGKRQEETISRRRNLDRNQLMEEGELLSEEEALAAQIMQENGNSVDLTA